MHTTEACDICAASGTMDSYLRVSLCGIMDAEIQRCSQCGFRQVRPRITPDELRRLYPDEYFDPDSAVGFSDYAREQQRNDREGYFLARRLRRISSTGRLLDVGCALGFLLDATKRYSGWDVHGIDVSTFAAYFARTKFGLNVQAGTLENAAFPDGFFDVVVQKDLLEHVLRPREHLVETRRILRPGGYLHVVTPNGEANLRPFVRATAEAGAAKHGQLPMLDQGHLSFFTRENLLRLFAETGFEVVRMRAIAVKRGLRALGYHPFKRYGVAWADAGRPRLGPATGAARPATSSQDEAKLEALAGKLDAEIKRLRRAVRSTPPYFAYRQLMRALDTLPAASGLGLDFQCILRVTAAPRARRAGS